MSSRRQQRDALLKLLYAWDVGHQSARLVALLPEYVASFGPPDLAAAPYVSRVIDTFDEEHSRLDDALRGALSTWRLERLGGIERAAMRLGAAELVACSETPVDVIIAEMVTLVQSYGGEESFKLVHAVLDRAQSALRPNEAASVEDAHSSAFSTESEHLSAADNAGAERMPASGSTTRADDAEVQIDAQKSGEAWD